MDEFAKIKDHLAKDPKVLRYQELEELIHKDKALLEEYKVLKDLQKKLVNAKVKQKPFEEIEQAYLAKYEDLLMHPLMGEYLDLVESINEDLQLITDIIGHEINMDL